MIGAIAGDIIGSRYEFNPIKTTDFELFGADCRFTDDTVLTVALAETLVFEKEYCRLLKKYFRRYPNAGYGKAFRNWAAGRSSKPYNSYGNGAAMRISPVGFYYDTLEEVLAKAEFYTAVTHNHPEGIKGAQATAAAIFLARNGSSKEEIRRYVSDSFGYDLNRTCDQIRPGYSFDVTCQGTVPQAIICFLESTDYESAVRLAVSLGGDSDTLACITGGIAEGFYGVPKWIEEKAMEYLDLDLMGMVKQGFYRYLCNKPGTVLSTRSEITPANLRQAILEWEEAVEWIAKGCDLSEYDYDTAKREGLDDLIAKYTAKQPLHMADAERIILLDEKFRSSTIETDDCVKGNIWSMVGDRLTDKQIREKYWYYFRWPIGFDEYEEEEEEDIE